MLYNKFICKKTFLNKVRNNIFMNFFINFFVNFVKFYRIFSLYWYLRRLKRGVLL
jgi:hypothetical protein